MFWTVLLLIVKTIALATAIVYTFANVGRALKGQGVSSKSNWLMGLSIALFILLQFWL